jgi:hypothetical protein
MAGATTKSSSWPRLSLPASAAATSATRCAASAASDDASAWKKAPAIAAAAGDGADTASPPFLAAGRLRSETPLPLVDGGADRATILAGLSMVIVAMVAIGANSLLGRVVARAAMAEARCARRCFASSIGVVRSRWNGKLAPPRVSRTGDRAYLRGVGGGQCVLEDRRLILRLGRPLVGEQRGGSRMNATGESEKGSPEAYKL